MRRAISATVAAVAISMVLAAPMSAITYGEPDGDNHPYVGVVVFYTGAPAEGTFLVACTGSLLSPTVVLVAGHCAGPRAAGTPVRAQVWFDEEVSPTPTGYPSAGGHVGTPHSRLPTSDVGVVVLDEPVPTSEVGLYAALPEMGVVDQLANKAALELVGYGVSVREQVSGPPLGRWGGPKSRLSAPSYLISGNQNGSSELLKHSNGPGGDSGGNCFGDSGGPLLAAGTDVVLATSTYVSNYNCSGVAYGTRIDVAGNLAWIDSFMSGS